jgi:hypothetical protein
MKDAMQDYFDTPPLGMAPKDMAHIKITNFKKEACDAPTPQGYRCTLQVTVKSENPLSQMYNNLPYGTFYKDKDSGKWKMRPPF